MTDSAVQMNAAEITNQLAIMGYELTDITAAMYFTRNSQDVNYIIDEIEKQQQITSLPAKPSVEISKIESISISFSSHPPQKLILECKSSHAKYIDSDDDCKLPNPDQIEWIEYIITDSRSSTNDYTLGNLDQNSKFMIRLSLKNKLGWSEWSDIRTFHTPEGPLFVNLLNPKQYTGKKREKHDKATNDSNDTNDSKESSDSNKATQQVDVRSLMIGDIMDGEDNWRVWYEAEVIEIDNDKGIKLAFKNWSDKFNEWVKCDETERFAPLNTKSLKFQDLRMADVMIISKPQCYLSKLDNKSYMIMVCNNCGIVRYDIETNKYELLMEDNIFKDVKVQFVSTSMDTINNIFYIVLNVNNIRAFNVDKKQWIVQNINKATDNQDEKEEENADKKENTDFEFINSVFVPGLNGKNGNGFHYLCPLNENENDEQIYYKYYGDNNKCEEIKIICKDLFSKNSDYGWMMSRPQLIESNMFYCKELNRILINKTYYEDRNRNYYQEWGYIDLNNKDNKYRKIEIDMKMNCGKNYLLGFGHLLFIFDLRLPQSIYCWDLLTNKYYECEKRFPKTKKNQNGKLGKFKYNITCGNNTAHLFDPYNNVHIKLDLFDLIPNELYNEKCYDKNKIQLLISGYLREFDEFEYEMPGDVIKIINNSYPTFL